MKTIWKYTLQPEDITTFEIPEGATILTAREQGSNICLWAAVDTEAPKVKRDFLIAGTNFNIPDEYSFEDLSFIGTAMLSNGALVFQVFEITK